MNDEQLRDRFFGTVLRYRYLGVLGRGGMSVVFKAMDLELDEVLAVKVLSPHVSVEDPDLLARFKREINLNRKIKHPNVQPLHQEAVALLQQFSTVHLAWHPRRESVRTFGH